LYSTPTGKLIKGWQYKNGKIIHTLSTGTATPTTLSVQSIGGGLKTEAFVCTDWYADYYVNDAYILSVFLGTTCADDGSGTPADHDPDGGGDGGSSSFPPPDGGVGGGNGGSASIPLQIKDSILKSHFPCATKLIVDSLLKIPGYANFVQPFITNLRPDLVWQDGTLPWNDSIPGSTAKNYQLGNTQSGLGGAGLSSTITLNTKMLQNSSQLFIAGTSIHETLHGYINFLVNSAGYNLTNGYINDGSWLYSLDSWALIYGLPANYSSHYQMLTDYFDKAVGILASWDNNSHTQKEYQMTMLYGLNNAKDCTQSQKDSLNSVFTRIANKYNITDSARNAFSILQLNSTNNKLPTTGCN